MFLNFRVSGFAQLDPAVIRHIYRELTGEATVPQNREVEKRLVIISEGNFDVIADLRSENIGRPGNFYDAFWKELGKVIAEVR